MCLRCDGYSEDEVARSIDLAVRVHGWALIPVEDERPWAYTVGLLETYQHPELVVTDLELSVEVSIINWAVRQIASRGMIDEAELARRELRAAEVHRSHDAGDWFGTWCRHYKRFPSPGDFVQLIPAPTRFCSCHRHALTRLDRPPTTRRTSR